METPGTVRPIIQLLIFATSLIIPWIASASNESPQTFTLDGQLYQAGTTIPLLDSAVKIKVQILNPSATCLLYEEEQTTNTKASDGRFTIYVGSGTGSSKRTVNDPGRNMTQIFQNLSAIVANSVPGQTCTGGQYVPLAGDVRYFRLIVTPSASNAPNTLTPDIVLDTVPQALVAQSVQGLERSGMLQVNTTGSTVLNQANLEALFTTPAYTNLQAILGGNFMKTDTSGASLPSYASDPAGASNGDIWFDTTTNEIKYKSAGGVQTVGASGGGSISSLTVGSSMSVNGTVAGTISSSGTIDLSNTGVAAGTYAKVTVDTKGRVTAGTVSLVEADIPNLTSPGKVSGNAITSGTISGSTAINTSGNLITTGTVSSLTVQATNVRIYNGSNYIAIVAPALAGIVNFTLPDSDGNPGEVLTTNGSGVLTWASGTTTLAGDVSGPSGATSVDKIKGKAVTAASVSGQIMIYDGTAWTNNLVSGDATLATNGTLSLNKVPVSKGGTNATSFGNNRIIASNGTGTVLQDFTCSLNQVITFDASGNAACANVTSLSASILNGGNTTGADISIGTNDNKAFSIKINNTTAMTISQNGNVGIGATAPAEKLEVNGGVKLGTTTGTNAGTIRWDGTNFQGYDGSAWANFVPNPPASGACGSTNTYTAAGTYTYTVPASFGTITIRLWGGGGAGGSAVLTASQAGGNSSIVSLGLVAGGGNAGESKNSGTATTAGSGGTATGGTVNTSGANGSLPSGGLSGAGGSSPNGGSGGISVTSNANGSAGSIPGGGGGGASYSGAAAYSSGGGAGGYVEKTFTTSTLLPGTTINDIVVGAGGVPAGGGYNGGAGGVGRVSIACTTTGAPAANDRGVVFLSANQHETDTNFVFSAAGNLGIGNPSPDEKLVVSNGTTTGKYTVSGWTHSSDARLKHDIQPLQDSLNKILQLQGVGYKFNADPSGKTQVGFVAQQVEPVFPEVVVTDEHGYKSMIYSNLVAPLVESVKSLYHSLKGMEEKQMNQAREIAGKADQSEIEKLKLENQKKEMEIQDLKQRLEKLEKALSK